jgi:hypothetical protein
MKKAAEKELLRKLRWMAGHVSGYIHHYQGRTLRNCAREIIVETWPDSEEAIEVGTWRAQDPDWQESTRIEDGDRK